MRFNSCSSGDGWHSSTQRVIGVEPITLYRLRLCPLWSNDGHHRGDEAEPNLDMGTICHH